MLTRIRKNMDKREEGFTLIELLVVMIIIGILAAIAIPVFLNQKKKAAETSAKSDAVNTARDAAAFYVDGGTGLLTIANGNNSAGTATATATLTYDGTETTDVRVGAKNTMTVIAGAGPDFCIVVDPALAGAATWSASQAGVFKSATC